MLVKIMKWLGFVPIKDHKEALRKLQIAGAYIKIISKKKAKAGDIIVAADNTVLQGLFVECGTIHILPGVEYVIITNTHITSFRNQPGIQAYGQIKRID